MATQYTLSAGYKWDREISSEGILTIMKNISFNELSQTIQKLDYQDKYDAAKIEPYIEAFNGLPTEDLTCRVNSQCVYMVASGSGVERYYKELVRRAYCLLTVEEGMKQGYLIDFTTS